MRTKALGIDEASRWTHFIDRTLAFPHEAASLFLFFMATKIKNEIRSGWRAEKVLEISSLKWRRRRNLAAEEMDCDC